eukprot:1798106-Rhodomonas_salina.2
MCVCVCVCVCSVSASTLIAANHGSHSHLTDMVRPGHRKKEAERGSERGSKWTSYREQGREGA